MWKKEDILKVVERRSGGSLAHDLRLWEAEAALDMKMTLESWYKLSLIEREHIVATRIATRWIDNLVIDEAVKEAKG